MDERANSTDITTQDFQFDWTLINSTILSNLTTSLTLDDVMTRTWLRVVLVTLYCVIFILGMAGNSLVVYVIVRNKSMQNPTNIFINNLALSDIMMCLLAVPFTPISGLSNRWIFGEALCYMVPMSLGVSVHVSSMTSIAIAVDRYFAIVHPFRPRMTSCFCCVVILAVWIAATTVSLPLAIFQEFEIDTETGVSACHESPWLPKWTRQGFTLASLVLQYIIPCGIITVCYSLVSAALNRRARAKKDMSSKVGHSVANKASHIEARSNGRVDSRSRSGPTNEREQLEIRRKRRTNRMLIAMVAIFVCCWLPLNVINLAVEYYQELLDWKYFLLLFFAAHVIAMSSTVYNPFLYAWMNDSFKKEFKKVIPFLFVCSDVCCAYFKVRNANVAIAQFEQTTTFDKKIFVRETIINCQHSKDIETDYKNI